MRDLSTGERCCLNSNKILRSGINFIFWPTLHKVLHMKEGDSFNSTAAWLYEYGNRGKEYDLLRRLGQVPVTAGFPYTQTLRLWPPDNLHAFWFALWHALWRANAGRNCCSVRVGGWDVWLLKSACLFVAAISKCSTICHNLSFWSLSRTVHELHVCATICGNAWSVLVSACPVWPSGMHFREWTQRDCS